MFSVTYTNKFTGNTDVAGYAETKRRAINLAKTFMKGGRLTDEAKVYQGQPGEYLLETLTNQPTARGA